MTGGDATVKGKNMRTLNQSRLFLVLPSPFHCCSNFVYYQPIDVLLGGHILYPPNAVYVSALLCENYPCLLLYICEVFTFDLSHK